MKNRLLLALLTALTSATIVGCGIQNNVASNQLPDINLGNKVESVIINDVTVTASSTSKDIECFMRFGGENGADFQYEKESNGTITYEVVHADGYDLQTKKVGNYSETKKDITCKNNDDDFFAIVKDISNNIKYGYYVRNESVYASSNSSKNNPMLYDDTNEQILAEVNKKPADFEEQLQNNKIYTFLKNYGSLRFTLFEGELSNNQSLKIDTYENYTKVVYHNDFGVLFNPHDDAFAAARVYTYEKALEFANSAINNKDYYVDNVFYINNNTGYVDYASGDFSGLLLNTSGDLIGKSSWIYKVLSEKEKQEYELEKEKEHQYALENFKVII